jgi:signal transduction histidine kinase
MASAAHAVAADPAAVVAAVVMVLRLTSAGARLDWRVEASLEVAARIDEDDLTEAVGALLENAARHAREVVVVAVDARAETVVITIDDDGPGIPEAELAGLTARGARLDRAGTGDGLGLAIATEIAEAAGGGITLANTAGGLRVTLTVPAVPRNLTVH